MSILIVCPQAVVPAWGLQIEGCRDKAPWGHQHKAAEWAKPRRAAMLALDMGTGKSLTALMIAGMDGIRPVLIGRGTNQSRARRLKTQLSLGGRPVVVVNYDSVWRGELAKIIQKHKWDTIILDESHRIKSPGGKASRWLALLAKANPKARLLALTGTPMPHSPLDLYGQFRFLDPAIFGTSFTRMRARYADCDPMFPSKVRKWLRTEELASILDANSFRVTADEVLDLPEAIHERIIVELPKKTRDFYDTLESDMVAEVDAGTVTVSNALTKLIRLQQATGGYAAIDGDERLFARIEPVPAKCAALRDFLEDLPAKEPLVVFCKFRSDISDVISLCEETGRRCSELSGERNTLGDWQKGQSDVIVVQIQSGGVGIDLTRAAYCCYYSLGFSLGDYEQSLARLRRPGQARCVRYYHVVAKDTIDESIYDALSARRDVVESVLSRLSSRTEK